MVNKKLNDEFDENSLIEMILLKLQDKAHDIFKYKKFKTYSSLNSELITQFKESRPVEYLQVELVRINQQHNEDVKSYAHRVEELVADLNSACIAREGEDCAEIIQRLNSNTALKAFVDGLKSSLQLIIKSCRFTTLKEAVSKAIEEEATLNYKLCSFSNTSSSPKNFPIKCQICKRNGHSAESCYRRKPNNLENSQDTTRTFENSNKSTVVNSTSQSYKPYISNQHQVVCGYCKRIGHHIRNCRSRTYAESNRNQNVNPAIQTINDSGNESSLVQEQMNTSVRVAELK